MQVFRPRQQDARILLVKMAKGKECVVAHASQSLLPERVVTRASQSLLPNGTVCGKGKNSHLVIPLTPPEHTYEEEPTEDPSNTEYQVSETSPTKTASDESTMRGTPNLMKNEDINTYHPDASLVRAIWMVLAEEKRRP